MALSACADSWRLETGKQRGLRIPADIRCEGSVNDIDMKRALAPFKRRLAAEAALRSVLASAMVVLPVWLGAAVYARLTGAAWGPARAALAVWGVLAALLYLLRLRPTDRAVAARLDALGLQDRTTAMVEFSGEDGVLYRLQREDAARKLQDISPKALRMSISKALVSVFLVLAALLVAAYLEDKN